MSQSLSVKGRSVVGGLAAAFFGLTAFIEEAQATLVKITITGTVQSGQDHGVTGAGVFGTPEGRYTYLTGQKYTLVLTFDDTKGQANGQGCTFPSCIQGSGASSPGTATLTIIGYAPVNFPNTGSPLNKISSNASREAGVRGVGGLAIFDVNGSSSSLGVNLRPDPAREFSSSSSWEGSFNYIYTTPPASVNFNYATTTGQASGLMYADTIVVNGPVK